MDSMIVMVDGPSTLVDGPSTGNLRFRDFPSTPSTLQTSGNAQWLKPLLSDSGRQDLRNRGLKRPLIQNQAHLEPMCPAARTANTQTEPA